MAPPVMRRIIRPHEWRRNGGQDDCMFCKEYMERRKSLQPWLPRFTGVDMACGRCEYECRNMIRDMRALSGFSSSQIARKNAECDAMKRYAALAKLESQRATTQRAIQRTNTAITLARQTGDTSRFKALFPPLPTGPTRKLSSN